MLTRWRWPAGTYETIERTLSENGGAVSYGEPTHWRLSVNGGAAYDLKLDRDVLGRITRHVELLDGTTRTFDYAYDEAGQLSSVEVDCVKTSAPPVSSTTSPSGAGSRRTSLPRALRGCRLRRDGTARGDE
jgi:hypothetical protein